MFNSSLRRVARTCPNASLSTPVRPNHGSIAATLTTASHQRRNSSSKPPIPPNSGPPPAYVKQVGAPRSSDKRPGAESRLSKRKVTKADKVESAKQKEDYSNEWTRSLPSVPSTQHLNPKDVNVASFFSTHRPISITGPLPPETSIADIDKIFAIRPKSQRKTQDVIYTISSAVQNLDDHVAGQEQQQAVTQHDEGVSQRADIIKALTQNNNTATNPADPNTHHLDSQPQQTTTSLRIPSNVKLVIQSLARQFRPFNPPPVPTAAPDVEFFHPERETSAQQPQPQFQSQSQAPTLEFDIDTEKTLQHQQEISASKAADSTNTFFTPSFDSPTSSLRTHRGSLQARHLMLKQVAHIRDIRRIGGINEMLLISVKRQRRLKMKKHKYKKLLRRTRTLRRRQGKV